MAKTQAITVAQNAIAYADHPKRGGTTRISSLVSWVVWNGKTAMHHIKPGKPMRVAEHSTPVPLFNAYFAVMSKYIGKVEAIEANLDGSKALEVRWLCKLRH